MGVGLAHDVVVGQGVGLPAQVTGHHPGRDSRRPHQEHEGARVVFAESAPGLEQEAVHRILPQQRRGQGIDEGLLAEPGQGPPHQVRIVAGGRAQLPRQRPGPGIPGLRQAQGHGPLEDEQARPGAVLGVGGGPVAETFGDGTPALQAQVGGQPRPLRRRGRDIERQQPGLIVRLEGQGVAHRPAQGLQFIPAGATAGDPARGPGAAVVAPQHGTAPVALARWRCGALEGHPERHRVGLAQPADAARFHAIAQPGLAAVGVPRQRPERTRHPGKEQEQHQHQRERLQQQPAGDAGGFPGIAGTPLPVQRHQGPGHHEHRGEQVGRHGDFLGEEELGDDEKVGQEDHQHRVPARAQLQQLQARHDHQQGDARIAPEQGVLGGVDRGGGAQRQDRPQPGRRQAVIAQRRPAVPRHPAERQQQDPGRQVQHMGKEHRGQCRRQPGEDAGAGAPGFHGAAPNRASASRQARRCPAPRSGPSSRPGRRSPQVAPAAASSVTRAASRDRRASPSSPARAS